MPLVFRRKYDDSELLLWGITETEAELDRIVTDTDRLSVAEFASSARRIERLAWRAALRAAAPDAKIGYNEYGAPFLAESGLLISVAHTEGMACVLLSERRCAVDVEKLSRDFSKSSHRYMSESEARLLEGQENPGCVAWCAKEAMYKYSGKDGVDFLRDLIIIGYDNGMVSGSMCGEPVEVRTFNYEGRLIAFIG